MDTVLRALAEPRRREILDMLRTNELSSGGIAARFDVTGPAISQHLRVLTEAGLVSMRRDGTRRLYQARPEGIAAVRDYLNGFWAEGLSRLAQEAEAEERRSGHGSAS